MDHVLGSWTSFVIGPKKVSTNLNTIYNIRYASTPDPCIYTHHLAYSIDSPRFETDKRFCYVLRFPPSSSYE